MNMAPKRIALRLALVVGLASAAILFLVMSTGLALSPLQLCLAVFALALPVTYLLINYALDKFIYRKIKLIYKQIHTRKLVSDKKVRKALGPDMIEKINREVSEWALEHKKEIEQLAEREKYRREFIGNITHELKTPLFNIEGYLSTLKEHGLDDKAMSRKFIERAMKSAERLSNLLSDLDAITRLESGALELYIQKINLAELVREVADSLEMKAKKAGIEIIFQREYNAPLWAMADKKRIRQVLTNLLDNAIYYGERGGRVELRFYDMEDRIVTEVSDDGIGIEAQHLPRLFERFYRVDASRSRQSGGTGLGLSIAKHIMDAHGQDIHVRSTAGVGSTFSFTLGKPEPLY